MKKLSTIIIAMALVLGMTQCKKKVETLTQSQGTFITVNVANESKHNVITTGSGLGEVEWTNGDILYVFSDGDFVGMVTYSSSSENFSGTINSAAEEKPLWFCFTGGVEPDGHTMTIDISDQSNNLPVLSCGASDQNYPTASNVYTAFLENKCALVKFTLSTGTDDIVRIGNMYTQARMTITAAGIDIEPLNETHSILLNRPSTSPTTERWAIILPQNNQITTSALIRNTAYKNCVIIPSTANNSLVNATIDLAQATTESVKPYFSVSGGRIVHFAPGNLQYQASTTTWQFADHEWDFVGGTDVNNVSWGNVSGSTNNRIGDPEYTGWIDLFGWGTGDAPTKVSKNYADYSTFNEWGNNINDGNSWFTLTDDEYDYLINETSNTMRANKIAPATVHGVGGFVMLPDYFDLTDYSFVTVADQLNHMEDCSQNVYTDAAWTAMSAAGAVFFPGCGVRSKEDSWAYNEYANETIDTQTPYKGIYACYWSKSIKGDNSAFALANELRTDGNNPPTTVWSVLRTNDYFYYSGVAVRLAKEVVY